MNLPSRRAGIASFESAVPALLDELQTVTKEVIGIHALLVLPFFDAGIPRRFLLRVSPAKSTSAF
jgi:hypothetical protein